MFKLKVFLKNLKFYKNKSNSFARSNTSRISKSVIYDSKKSADTAPEILNNETFEIKSRDEIFSYLYKKLQNSINLIFYIFINLIRKEPLNDILKSNLKEQIEISTASDKKDYSPKKLNFDSFKKRNLQLNKNLLDDKNNIISNREATINKIESKSNKNDNDDESHVINSQEFDEKLISQLNKYIKEEGTMFNTSVEDNNKRNHKNLSDKMDNEIEDEIENKFDGILVKRPHKGFVWGMGNQTNKKKCIY